MKKVKQLLNRTVKSLVKDEKKKEEDIYATYKEGKSIFQLFKYMTSLLKNVYIDNLTQFVKELNNIVHRTIIIRPVDVKPDTCIDLDVEINTKNQNLRF